MSTTPPPPPPPPEEQYPSFSNNGGPDVGNEIPESLDVGRPNVASNPGRVIAVLSAVGLVLIILLYNVFFGHKKDDNAKPKELGVAKATLEPPPLPAEPPTFTPPPVPEPTKVPIIKQEDNGPDKSQLRARLHSSMLVADGTSGGGPLSDVLGGDNTPATDDANLKFAGAVTRANTKAARVTATNIGNLSRTIAQGRLIQATLETALNTDLPAPIRAIVSRDTYGEAGTKPLIPKGSRLIGVYNTDLTGGQSRVFVMWTRVIRPDGIDVMINSPTIDQIGQAGLGGQVDTHFQEIFSRSIMSSVVSIGFAIGADKLTPGGGDTSTTVSGFGTSQSGNAASTATTNALNRLGSVTQGFLEKFIDIKPTILVDQGTPVNVFVNRDLVFPAELVGTNIIQ